MGRGSIFAGVTLASSCAKRARVALRVAAGAVEAGAVEAGADPPRAVALLEFSGPAGAEGAGAGGRAEALSFQCRLRVMKKATVAAVTVILVRAMAAMVLEITASVLSEEALLTAAAVAVAA